MNLYYKVELNTAPPDSCSKSAFLVTESMLGSTASQYHHMNWSKLKPHNLPPAISFKLNKSCFPHGAEICKSETRVSLHNDINICVHRSTGMWAQVGPPHAWNARPQAPRNRKEGSTMKSSLAWSMFWNITPTSAPYQWIVRNRRALDSGAGKKASSGDIYAIDVSAICLPWSRFREPTRHTEMAWQPATRINDSHEIVSWMSLQRMICFETPKHSTCLNIQPGNIQQWINKRLQFKISLSIQAYRFARLIVTNTSPCEFARYNTRLHPSYLFHKDTKTTKSMSCQSCQWNRGHSAFPMVLHVCALAAFVKTRHVREHLKAVMHSESLLKSGNTSGNHSLSPSRLIVSVTQCEKCHPCEPS